MANEKLGEKAWRNKPALSADLGRSKSLELVVAREWLRHPTTPPTALLRFPPLPSRPRRT